jgi:hypothetical protein
LEPDSIWPERPIQVRYGSKYVKKNEEISCTQLFKSWLLLNHKRSSRRSKCIFGFRKFNLLSTGNFFDFRFLKNLVLIRIQIQHKALISVADPDPGSGALLTPGSGMNNHLDHISESLETIFWVKILKFFDANQGWKKLGSVIIIPDPQHWL